MTKINNDFRKSCSSNSIILSENCLQEDLVDKRPWKLALNSENVLFLMTRLQLLVQDKQISLEYVDLHAKRMLILDTRVWTNNPTDDSRYYLWCVYDFQCWMRFYVCITKHLRISFFLSSFFRMSYCWRLYCRKQKCLLW